MAVCCAGAKRESRREGPANSDSAMAARRGAYGVAPSTGRKPSSWRGSNDIRFLPTCSPPPGSAEGAWRRRRSGMSCTMLATRRRRNTVGVTAHVATPHARHTSQRPHRSEKKPRKCPVNAACAAQHQAACPRAVTPNPGASSAGRRQPHGKRQVSGPSSRIE